MLNLCNHSIVLLFLFVFAIIGCYPLSRYLTFREVECIKSVQCPTELHGGIYSHVCLETCDIKNNNHISISNLELWPTFDIVFPQKCWINGPDITIINPEIVVIIYYAVFGIFVCIYLIVAYCSYKKNVNRIIQSKLAHLKVFTYVVSGLFTILALFSLCCVFASIAYVIQYHEVECLQYTECVDDSNHKLASYPYCVLYNDTSISEFNIVENTMAFEWQSYLPNVLPQRCWTNNKTITFYNSVWIIICALIVLVLDLSIFLPLLCFVKKENRRVNLDDSTSDYNIIN